MRGGESVVNVALGSLREPRCPTGQVSTKAGQVQRPAASDPPRWARLAGSRSCGVSRGAMRRSCWRRPRDRAWAPTLPTRRREPRLSPSAQGSAWSTSSIEAARGWSRPSHPPRGSQAASFEARASARPCARSEKPGSGRVRGRPQRPPPPVICLCGCDPSPRLARPRPLRRAALDIRPRRAEADHAPNRLARQDPCVAAPTPASSS